METLDEIRDWLGSVRGSYTKIAASTELSVKTISRIANDPEHSVNLRTLQKLSAARVRLESAAA